ncbi:hypothetical protein ScPMuIL_008845 [Solemya velum]
MHLKKTLLPILTFALVLAWYGMEAKSKFKDTLRRDSRRARYSTKKILKRRNKSEKPNIVLILTDDQDKLLGSMNVMPKTRKILEALGADFNNSFVNTPMCCPSRSTLLTGLYTHNHHVYTNNNNCSSLYWQQTHEPRSFANYLSNVGYRTGFFGKYLNEYNGTYIPPGWREWVGLIRNSKFYNYTINFNGNKIKHYDNYYKDYLTDLIANDSVTFLKQSKQYFSNRPVLMVLSVPAPHGPEDSAPQYQHLFENNTMHRTPTWNVAPNLDKQWLLKTLDPMEPITKRFTDILHQKRLQTLQSVDDLVEKVHNELRDLDELDNTFIIYTSDHGYHLGQFGVIKGKALPYDFDVRVPLYIRGPGIRPKTKISNIISHVDIAPTILDMAGVDIPEHMDGESILRLTKAAKDINNVDENGFVSCKKPWRDTVIVERGDQKSGETFDQYLTELRTLARDCKFEHLKDGLIEDRLVGGLLDEETKHDLRKIQDLTLEKCITVCRSAETAEKLKKNYNKVESSDRNVDAVGNNKHRKSNHKTTQRYAKGRTSNSVPNKYEKQKDYGRYLCKFCGIEHRDIHCPASGQICYVCNGRDHFAHMCKKKKNTPRFRKDVYAVDIGSDDEPESENDEFFIDVVEDIASDTSTSYKSWVVPLKVNGTIIPMKLDTGADVDILGINDFSKLNPKPKLHPSKIKLKAYDGGDILVKGQCIVNVEHKNGTYISLFTISSVNVKPILGRKSCDRMGLVKRVLAVDSNCTETQMKEPVLDTKGDSDTLFENFKD